MICPLYYTKCSYLSGAKRRLAGRWAKPARFLFFAGGRERAWESGKPAFGFRRPPAGLTLPQVAWKLMPAALMGQVESASATRLAH